MRRAALALIAAAALARRSVAQAHASRRPAATPRVSRGVRGADRPRARRRPRRLGRAAAAARRTGRRSPPRAASCRRSSTRPVTAARPLTASGVYYLPVHAAAERRRRRGASVCTSPTAARSSCAASAGRASPSYVGAARQRALRLVPRAGCSRPRLAGGYLPILEVAYTRRRRRPLHAGVVRRPAAAQAVARQLHPHHRRCARLDDGCGHDPPRLVARADVSEPRVARGQSVELDAAFVHDGARARDESAPTAYERRSTDGRRRSGRRASPPRRASSFPSADVHERGAGARDRRAGDDLALQRRQRLRGAVVCRGARRRPGDGRLRLRRRVAPDPALHAQAASRALHELARRRAPRRGRAVLPARRRPALRRRGDPGPARGRRPARTRARRRVETGLLPRERYSSDIADEIYSLQGQTLVWQGLLAMGRVWAETGHTRRSPSAAGSSPRGWRRACAGPSAHPSGGSPTDRCSSRPRCSTATRRSRT